MAQFPQARRAEIVTPSDTLGLPGGACEGLYCNGAGAVTVLMEHGSAPMTFTVPATSPFLPIKAQRVLATGTTVPSIIALY